MLTLGFLFIIIGVFSLIICHFIKPEYSHDISLLKTFKKIFIGNFVLGIGLVIFNTFHIIPAGEAGVVEFWGTVSPKPRTAGVNLINPLAKLYTFSVRTQEVKEQISDAPASDNLPVNLDMSLLYHYDYTKLSDAVKTIGKEEEIIMDVIILPTFRSIIRDKAKNFTAMSLYTDSRESYTQSVRDELESKLSERCIIVENILLRSVSLPQKVSGAIEEKLQAEQEAKKMEFVLQKEEQEAERKRVEAAGIRDANKIIAQGLTASYIQWYRIEMLREYAKSNNNTILVIPEDLKSLPMLMNNQK